MSEGAVGIASGLRRAARPPRRTMSSPICAGPAGGCRPSHGPRAGARPAARCSGTSRSTSPRRSRTPPACCRQGARRAGRGSAGRLALRLLSLLDRQDARSSSRSAAGSSSTCSSRTRSATRRATWPAVWGRNFRYPCRDPLPPAERQLGARRRVPARRVRPRCGATSRRSPGARGHRRRAARARSPSSTRTARLLRELYAIKRETPVAAAGRRGLRRWSRSAACMPREEHNALLARVLPLHRSARRARPQDKIRVVFEGGFCEQPPLDLLRTIGQSCYVVDDDLLIGLRWIAERRADRRRPAGRPRRGLPRAVVATARCSTTCASRRSRCCSSASRASRRRRRHRHGGQDVRARARRAGGLLAARSTRRGIPYFVSEFEENMTSFDHLQIQLETFVENLLFD